MKKRMPFSRKVIIYMLFLLCILRLVTEKIVHDNLSETKKVETTRDPSSKAKSKNLIVFNAIGKRSNVPLVEHARRRVFTSDKWDCIAFMVSKEDRIPDDDVHLRALIDELNCSVPRTPGLHWGDFLQFVTPTLVSSYDYVGIALDDVFVPHEGDSAFNADVFLERMKKYKIDVMQPAIVNDSHKVIETATKLGVDQCIAEAPVIETYLEIFTREAWECFYNNLHYTGSRGWCYELCFKKKCSNFITAQDFTMIAYHMDRFQFVLPHYDTRIVVPADLKWNPEGKAKEHGYDKLEKFEICRRCDVLSNSKLIIPRTPMPKIFCPNEKTDE